MNYWRKMETSTRRFYSIVTAIGFILVILTKIAIGVHKITNIGMNISRTLVASEEHTKYIGLQIDRAIADANRKLDSGVKLSPEEIRYLTQYRKVLVSTMTEKQKNAIELIEIEYKRRY